MTTANEACFNVFSQFAEGLTGFEFIDLLDNPQDKASATSRLSQYVIEGLAVKTSNRRSCPKTGRHGVVYVATGKAYSERKPHPHRARDKDLAPIDVELASLRAWKANAIKQYPSLGTAPEILAARKAWAAALRSEGEEIKAQLVEGGGLDDTEHMRVLLHVLSGAPKQN